MTQGQMIETIRGLFPDVGETELRITLNNAYRRYIAKTRIYSSNSFTLSTVVDQRYYNFSDLSGITNNDDIIGVFRVDYDGSEIKRYQGPIPDTDAT